MVSDCAQLSRKPGGIRKKDGRILRSMFVPARPEEGISVSDRCSNLETAFRPNSPIIPQLPLVYIPSVMVSQ